VKDRESTLRWSAWKRLRVYAFHAAGVVLLDWLLMVLAAAVTDFEGVVHSTISDTPDFVFESASAVVEDFDFALLDEEDFVFISLYAVVEAGDLHQNSLFTGDQSDRPVGWSPERPIFACHSVLCDVNSSVITCAGRRYPGT
jgi:hypothetical protein